MNIHEYQAKLLLNLYGIVTFQGILVSTPAEARSATLEFGGRPVVIKAQVHAGGRGKSGGIQFAQNADEAEIIALKLLGSRLATAQAEDLPIDKVLVVEKCDIENEHYLSLAIDYSRSQVIMMISTSGGVDIEAVSQQSPERIKRIPIDPQFGMKDHHAYDAAEFFGLPASYHNTLIRICRSLYRLMIEKECTLIEINPLVITTDGRLMPLDVKINFDDNALFRHPEIECLRDLTQENEREAEAHKSDIAYISLSGNIGCLVNGAGLAMATMDAIKEKGGAPANFLDVGGGASAEKVETAFRIILSDRNVKGILINVFAGITSCAVIARGIASAARKTDIRIPLIVRLEGNEHDEGVAILLQSGIRLKIAGSLAEAATMMVQLVKNEVQHVHPD